MRDKILAFLPEEYPWKDRLHYVSTVGSTNDLLKQWAAGGAPEGTVLVAGEQTLGKGRLGRHFHSPEGTGVYLSMLLRPDCDPGDLMHLTCAVGTAMAEAVEEAAGFRPRIKWTNDLVYGHRKLGGILTELGFGSGSPLYCILGIGINCLQAPGDFPPELQDMAASLSMIAGRPVEPALLAARMMTSLYRMNGLLLTGKQKLLDRYRRDCITVGSEISLIRGDEIRHGKAVDIDENGALIVEFSSGIRETVNSGEVSIRGMYGYV